MNASKCVPQSPTLYEAGVLSPFTENYSIQPDQQKERLQTILSSESQMKSWGKALRYFPT